MIQYACHIFKWQAFLLRVGALLSAEEVRNTKPPAMREEGRCFL